MQQVLSSQYSLGMEAAASSCSVTAPLAAITLVITFALNVLDRLVKRWKVGAATVHCVAPPPSHTLMEGPACNDTGPRHAAAAV